MLLQARRLASHRVASCGAQRSGMAPNAPENNKRTLSRVGKVHSKRNWVQRLAGAFHASQSPDNERTCLLVGKGHLK